MINKISIYSFVVILSSCASIYFTSPQPIDSINIITFPENIQGTWITGKDTTIISKYKYADISWRLFSIPMNKLDSNKKIVIKNNKIYNTKNDTATGYSFNIINDTLYTKVIDEKKHVALGDSSFLRKVSEVYFIANLKKDSIWWDILLIDLKNSDQILIRYPNKSDIKILRKLFQKKEIEITIPFIENELTTSEHQKFLNVDLTKNKMLDFINSGGFSDTIKVLKSENKIK